MARIIVKINPNNYVTEFEVLTDQTGPRKTIREEVDGITTYSFHNSKIPTRFYTNYHEYKVNNGNLIFAPNRKVVGNPTLENTKKSRYR